MPTIYRLNNTSSEIGGISNLYNWLEFTQNYMYIKEYDFVASFFIG